MGPSSPDLRTLHTFKTNDTEEGKGQSTILDWYSASSWVITSEALRYGMSSQGILQFYLHTHIFSPQSEWAIPVIAFPAITDTHLPTPEGWKTELAWVADCAVTQFISPKEVIHHRTNRAQCSATAFIETNALPLHQTATQWAEETRTPGVCCATVGGPPKTISISMMVYNAKQWIRSLQSRLIVIRLRLYVRPKGSPSIGAGLKIIYFVCNPKTANPKWGKKSATSYFSRIDVPINISLYRVVMQYNGKLVSIRCPAFTVFEAVGRILRARSHPQIPPPQKKIIKIRRQLFELSC